MVTLPEGIAVNPASAGGLDACSEGELAREDYDSAPGEGCPQASKLATVAVETPLLHEQLTGSVYLAEPHANPFGSLLAGYLVIRQPERGIIIRLAGKIEADPRTGQLTASFDQNPELPFSELSVSFPPGPRASLITPPTCGGYRVRTELYPHADPGSPVVQTDPFQIAGAPGGGPCPTSASQLPHSPGFDAGSVSPLAGRHSPFLVNLRRDDGSQRFSTVKITPAAGADREAGRHPGLPRGRPGRRGGEGRPRRAIIAVSAYPGTAGHVYVADASDNTLKVYDPAKLEAVAEDPQARRLPPGSHGIPADVVARNQRERLVAALAEVCAERSYAEASVAAVAKRAGVSSVTFYKQFGGKRVHARRPPRAAGAAAGGGRSGA